MKIQGKQYIGGYCADDGRKIQVESGVQGGAPVAVHLASEASYLYIVHDYDIASAAPFMAGAAFHIRGVKFDPWFRVEPSGLVVGTRVDHWSHASSFSFSLPTGDVREIDFEDDVLISSSGRWLTVRGNQLFAVADKSQAAKFRFYPASAPVGTKPFCVAVNGYMNGQYNTLDRLTVLADNEHQAAAIGLNRYNSGNPVFYGVDAVAHEGECR